MKLLPDSTPLHGVRRASCASSCAWLQAHFPGTFQQCTCVIRASSTFEWLAVYLDVGALAPVAATGRDNIRLISGYGRCELSVPACRPARPPRGYATGHLTGSPIRCRSGRCR